MAEFDTYAHRYDSSLAAGLSATGEGKDYFAQGRTRWLAQCLREIGIQPCRILDYGCGTGSAEPWLLKQFGTAFVVGVDISEASIERAIANHRSGRTAFYPIAACQPNRDIDLAFCNGVFHHIPTSERKGALAYISGCLRPDGLFAFWENNPWNPGTRYVMSRVGFDKDAIPVSAPAARRLLQSAGFRVLRTDFLFIFPKFLKLLRPLERKLSAFPLGGQYQVLCRKANLA